MTIRSPAIVVAGVLAAAACHVYVREPYDAYQPAPRPPQPQVVRPAPPAPPQPARASARWAVASPTPTSPPLPTTCLDTGAEPVGDCNAINLPDANCDQSSSARQKCGVFKTYFDAKVAAIAVSCVTALSPRQLCDPSQPLLCAKTALAQACADPSVVQVCKIAATSCKTTRGECSALLSGLNDEGQLAVAQCVADGCPEGLGGCIDGLPVKGPVRERSAASSPRFSP